MSIKTLLLVGALSFPLVACGNTTQERALSGGAIGAGAGAVGSSVTGGSPITGALIGGAASERLKPVGQRLGQQRLGHVPRPQHQRVVLVRQGVTLAWGGDRPAGGVSAAVGLGETGDQAPQHFV